MSRNGFNFIRKYVTLMPRMIADDLGCRNEFEKATGLDKKDFSAIEYLMRKGQRQLEMYASPGIKDIR